LDIQNYISSGILESYVLGVLEDSEAAEVARLSLQHPEIQKEIEAIEIALLAYSSAGNKPSKDLKGKIFADFPEKEAKHIYMAPPSRFGSYIVAASVSVLVVSMGINFYLFNRWSDSRDKLSVLQDEKTTMAEQLNSKQVSFEALQRSLALLENPDNIVIPLQGTPDFPSSKAVVYWNKASNEVYISGIKLPDPGEGLQYQLWALVGATPIDAGVFDTGNDMHVQKMYAIAKADKFAITLEKKGGNATPTGKIYVLGNAS